jgi:hypothetical protein
MVGEEEATAAGVKVEEEKPACGRDHQHAGAWSLEVMSMKELTTISCELQQPSSNAHINHEYYSWKFRCSTSTDDSGVNITEDQAGEMRKSRGKVSVWQVAMLQGQPKLDVFILVWLYWSSPTIVYVEGQLRGIRQCT